MDEFPADIVSEFQDELDREADQWIEAHVSEYDNEPENEEPEDADLQW